MVNRLKPKPKTQPVRLTGNRPIITNYVCVCVCVHHINRSGLNLMTNSPSREQKCGCRSGPWSAGQEGEKGNKKPEIPNPVEKDKATQKQSKKSKRDGNRHARSRTLTPGGRSKRCPRYGARRTMESNHQRYSRRGRQTVSNTSLTRQLVHDSNYDTLNGTQTEYKHTAV